MNTSGPAKLSSRGLSVTPYYEHGGITIYHGDFRDVMPHVEADVMVTDPPFGIAYRSGRDGVLPRSIRGDLDVSLRDDALAAWAPRPAIVFGSWKRPRPVGTRALLVWDTKGALGMVALDIPWKPAHQEIYIIGSGFHGKRSTDVLRFAPVQSMASHGRVHPHEKPVPLLSYLLDRCPEGVILDPFMGGGSTLRAAKDIGRRAIGIEIDERYCEAAAKGLAQEVLPFGSRRDPEAEK